MEIWAGASWLQYGASSLGSPTMTISLQAFVQVREAPIHERQDVGEGHETEHALLRHDC